jgi:predicted transcriptional regulator of viral defense system
VNRQSISLSAFVDRLQQSGRYTFDRKEALKELKTSPVALKLSALRLARQGRLVAPRRGFFVIVPLEYKSAGSPPPSWFIAPLMNFEGESYYVGLLSAAALHGAAHQQPQEFQVMASRQLKPAMARAIQNSLPPQKAYRPNRNRPLQDRNWIHEGLNS